MLGRLIYLVRRFKTSILGFLMEQSPAAKMLEVDIDRWILMNDRSQVNMSFYEKIMWLLYTDDMEEFRNLFYYRIGSPADIYNRFLLFLSKMFFKPRSSLTINTPVVGTGLVIKHGFNTLVEANSIGKNCLIFQGVVIGHKDNMYERPILGDYVHVSAGAKILGNVTIGDHSIIAANAVVTKDMPPNSLAIGVPTRIVRGYGNRAEYVALGEIPA